MEETYVIVCKGDVKVEGVTANFFNSSVFLKNALALMGEGENSTNVDRLDAQWV